MENLKSLPIVEISVEVEKKSLLLQNVECMKQKLTVTEDRFS